VESCPLLDSVGRTLAADFAAPVSLPRHTYSAMDGFATRRAFIKSASEATPAVLAVVGESRPGKPPDGISLAPGQAIAIATGGAIPPGVDAIHRGGKESCWNQAGS
jgi:molybdopterin biosynthesis enzyme